MSRQLAANRQFAAPEKAEKTDVHGHYLPSFIGCASIS
jgi:hypothetical protein